MRPSVPSAQDVVRLIRPSDGETFDALKRHYERRPSVWNYRTSRAVAEPLFSGDISCDAAVAACKRGHPLGWKANTEVIEHIWRAAQRRRFYCHTLSPELFEIRRDLSILVDPPFYFVEDRKVKIFWLQPRRGYAPTIEGMGILAIMIRMAFAHKFDDADLELLDLSVPKGESERVARVFALADLPQISDATVADALQRFARAYDKICELGVKRPERRRQPSGQAERDLFDKSER